MPGGSAYVNILIFWELRHVWNNDMYVLLAFNLFLVLCHRFCHQSFSYYTGHWEFYIVKVQVLHCDKDPPLSEYSNWGFQMFFLERLLAVFFASASHWDSELFSDLVKVTPLSKNCILKPRPFNLTHYSSQMKKLCLWWTEAREVVYLFKRDRHLSHMLKLWPFKLWVFMCVCGGDAFRTIKWDVLFSTQWKRKLQNSVLVQTERINTST